MQEDLKGLEPTLNAEAGSTEEAAKHAGTHGYVDKELHAGASVTTWRWDTVGVVLQYTDSGGCRCVWCQTARIVCCPCLT